jgi:5'-nucleotidase
MKILITNDDGINSSGIQVIAKYLHVAGHEITVAAPIGESSGSSAGVGPVHSFGSVQIKEVKLKDLPGVKAFSLDCLPALIVLTACMGGFGERPDLVVAGINNGLNIGRSVMHSGTVGAALTASHFKIPAVAISIGWSETPRWEIAASLATLIINHLDISISQILNLNVPNTELNEIKGIKITNLAPTGLIKGASFKQDKLDLNLSPEKKQIGQNTDLQAVNEGYASLTALTPVKEDQGSAVYLNELISKVIPALIR